MKLPLLPASLVLSAFLALSCSKVADAPGTPGLSHDPSESSGPEVPFQTGRSIVQLSEALADIVEASLDGAPGGGVRTRSSELDAALADLGATSIERLFPDAGEYEPRTRAAGLHRLYVIEYSAPTSSTRASASLGSVSGVEHVEGEMPVTVCGFDDPYYREQWQYSNSAIKGFDVNVEPVWKHYTTGRPDVVVAVVDGGIDLGHPDLARNCYGEHYNFVDNSSTIHPYDHGVHVAGIIGAVNNNGIGVSGLAGGDAASGKLGVKLMSCQTFKTVTNSEGKQVTANGSSARAIKWAADHGASLAQNSWGYSYDKDGDGTLSAQERENAMKGTVSLADKLAIDYFIKYAGCDNDGNQLPGSPMKGGVVFFSAGNNSLENGVPANYEPVVAVGAVTSTGTRASYSNYGSFVDIAAPGSNIYSTISNGKYGTKSGTSMACPQVTGVAALVLSLFGGPGFTNEMLKEKLLGGANKSILSSSLKIGGLVDALGAIDFGGGQAPAPVDDLSVEVVSNSLIITWTVPATPAGAPAHGFRIICGQDRDKVEKAGLSTTASSSLRVVDLVPGLDVGEKLSQRFNNLAFGAEYHIKVLSYSYFKYTSPALGVVSTKTKENHPPTIDLDAEDLVLKSFEAVEIPMAIEDPDGHTLKVKYTSGSRADSYDQLQDRSFVRIDASKEEPGTYTLSIEATDSYGASASRSLTYTILANRPPEVVGKPEDMILHSIGQRLSLDLREFFRDEDGERLSYAVRLSDKSVATVAVDAEELRATITGYGRTDFTIEAMDARKASAQVGFRLLVRTEGVDCQMYPNPVKDVLSIATGLERMATGVRLYSSTGALLSERTMETSAFEPGQLDMSACAPGKYSVVVVYGPVQSRQTIVKK